MRVYPVILCGGAGTRLWPVSRAWRPKPFLPLTGETSSFQNTLARLEGLDGVAETLIVAGADHAATARRQAGPAATILAEPKGRDSAPAIAAAMVWIAERDPEGLAVILASDHHVADAADFRAALAIALAGAAAGLIVTLGVAPTVASAAYGYILPGEPIGEGPLRRVGRFCEKPAPADAQALIDAGGLWNSGNFVAGAATLIAELERHAPQVLAAARAGLAAAREAGGVLALGPAFAEAPKISIDYAVMEKTDRAAVLPVAFAWSDLGAWDAVWAASPADAAGNAVTGEALLEDSERCLVRAHPGQRLALVGVRDLAVIVEADAILVCDRAASQQVKAIAERAGKRLGAPPSTSLAEQAAWFRRWLTVAALPAWWALAADRERGGFHDALDADGRPLRGPRRSRVQTRQTWVYAEAGALCWPGPWREAVDHGAAYLAARFVRPDGLHRTLVGETGTPADDTAHLYDQAFALLALAARGPAHETEARGLLTAIQGAFSHPDGGFTETGPARFAANPLMHLFEAALAWLEAGGRDPVWRALAQALADLADERLIDPATGAIAETYDDAWRPEPTSEVWPGHQFEWAWLMLRWFDLSGEVRPKRAARRLYDAGARGVLASGVTANAMDRDLNLIDRAARLWPQTERLKAALALARHAAGSERDALEADALSAALALRRYLAVPAAGLWLDVIDAADAPVAGPAPASSLYHLLGAVRALAWPAAEAAGAGAERPALKAAARR